MRMIGWFLLFVFAFLLALVLVLTFMQPPFKQEVGAQILTYTTRPLPVYIYVLGSFAAGLGLGCMAALFGFFGAKRREHRLGRRIRELEQEVAAMRKYSPQAAPAAGPQAESPPHETTEL